MIRRSTSTLAIAALCSSLSLTCGGDEPSALLATEANTAEAVASVESYPEAVVAPATAEAPVSTAAVPAEPPSDDDDLPCGPGMVLVEGSHCYFREQACLRWDDPEGHPTRRVCGEFNEKSRCIDDKRHTLRFCIDRDEYVPEGQDLPAVDASWSMASQTCNELGKRLCTNLEWEFACEGEEGLPYPYGATRSPSLCNQDRVIRDGPRKARGDLREPPHPSCVSPFGVRDMVGNVDEWVTRPYGEPPFRSELRGGWWMTGRNRCRAATTAHDEHYAGRQTGFRCCRDVIAPETVPSDD